MVQKLAYQAFDSSNVFQGAFLVVPACPIEKVTLCFTLTSGFETSEGVVKDKISPKLGIDPGLPVPSPLQLTLNSP